MLPLKSLIFLALIFGSAWTLTVEEYSSLPPYYHFDDYDNCMLYGDNALYCGIIFELFPENQNNVSRAWNLIQKTMSNMLKRDKLVHGICLTKRCPHIPKDEILKNSFKAISDVGSCYGATFHKIGLSGKVNNITCREKKHISVDGYDVAFGAFLLSVVSLVLFAWFCDISYNPKENNFFGEYISSFSLLRNWKRLTNVDITDPDMKAFRCLQGVRLLNCCYMIIVHTVVTSMMVPLRNSWHVESIADSKKDRISGLNYNQMQPFFFLSVWFVTYNFLKEAERKNEVSLSYIFRRIWIRYFRITPLKMITVFSFATWTTFVADGPLWNLFIEIPRIVCRKKWWIKLLFLNDFDVPAEEMCLATLWSLAIDFHLCITILVILWAFWKNPRGLAWVVGIIWVYHVIVTFIETHKLKLAEQIPLNEKRMRELVILYSLFTTNLPAALSGATFSYIYFKYRNEKLFTKNIRLMWILVVSSFVAALSLQKILISLFGHTIKTNETIAAFTALSRTFFNFGLGLLVLLMTKGHGGVILRLAECEPVYVLGRLTYAAYLLHPFIFSFKFGLMRAPGYFNGFLQLFEGLSDVAMSFLVAVPVTLFFEMPFEEMRSRIFKSRGKSVESFKKE